MDWQKCVICQSTTGETLQCPANSKRKDVGAGYMSFVKNLSEFQSLDLLPATLNTSLLDEGQGIEGTLLGNKASWHKSCRECFSNTKLERAKRKRKTTEGENAGGADETETTGEQTSASPIKARRSGASSLQESPHCFICEKPDNLENLRSASTFRVDQNVRKCAELLKDSKLIAKLSAGDLMAVEAKYHAKCLVSLYNRAKRFKPEISDVSLESSHNVDLEELAYAELIAFIDECLKSEDPVVLKLSDLTGFYSSKLKEMGLECENVNATRLKNRILGTFPDLSAHSSGVNVLLVLKEEIGGVLKGASEKDDEAFYLAKAANIIRRDVLRSTNSFNGSFTPTCQQDAVPATLKTFIGMVTKGPTTNINAGESQACLSIAQLIVFNAVSRLRNRSEGLKSTRHTRSRECPLPIYTAIKLHGTTRDRSLIDTFYQMGICISYDRLLTISTEVSNAVIERYEREGVVCPPQLKEGLFTTGAVDNIDHNPSSTTSQDSFHGTAISLVQHPNEDNCGQARAVDVIDPDRRSSSKRVPKLPSFFSEVPPVAQAQSDLYAPAVTVTPNTDLQAKKDNEQDWLDSAKELLDKEEIDEKDNVSWAAYRASKSALPSHDPAIIALLPMFLENAHSLAMIAHALKVIQSAVRHVNPSQTPVVALDQPLFALAKQIQWTIGDPFSEDKLVCMMGGLHIEMVSFKAAGKWLAGSGWVEVLSNAGVATQGVADSFLTASHLTRTRRAHQVTAISLYILMCKAYSLYTETARPNEVKSFQEWKAEKYSKCPHFRYWTTVLEIELCCLQLVRAFREANFEMYVTSLRQILPWMFALDHQNYARWLSVHYRDMCNLQTKHPNVHQEFSNGNFVVHKTQRRFSAIALDQAHEQVNANVKGEGGAVGLTENPAALRRWMVAGPELSRMIQEFEGGITTSDTKSHHEQTPGVQRAFTKDVINTVSSFEELGNPFLEEGDELLMLHTKDIMDSSVITTIFNARNIGEQQCCSFIKERFINRKKSVTDPLKKNNFPTFDSSKKKVISKDKAKVALLKEDCALFSRLYIACQSRDGNLDEFFKFENQPWPPSLSEMGQLRSGQKADLIKCFTSSELMEEQVTELDAIILDGAVIVQMLHPRTAQTFEEYFNDVFAPYILRHLESVKRVDVVWDVYHDDSLKRSTREKRGTGQRRRVLTTTKIPSNWQGFLRVDSNKDELFKLLASKAVLLEVPHGKEIYSTFGEDVLSSSARRDMSSLAPCSHEEADTRLMIHVRDASMNGHRRIKIRSNDTDVVVLAISVVHSLQAEELWIAFGMGKNLRDLPAHAIARSLGQEKTSALPMFHAVTGCDTVSFFAGRGKKTAWDVWTVFPNLTTVLTGLGSSPAAISKTHMDLIQRFVVLLYDRTSSVAKVNEVRQELFARKSRSLDSIPPTEAALLQHVKRAVFQGGHVWGNCLLPQPELPSPADWGWKRDGSQWLPLWTTLPQAKDTCYELIKCGCKVTCVGRCKCAKANLACTGLCKCGGSCA